MTRHPSSSRSASPAEPLPEGSRRWEDLTAPEVAELAGRDPVALLPLGAIEQHGPHLPVSTDLVLAQGILHRALELLEPHGSVVILPALAVGTSDEHARLPGTLTLGARALEDVLVDLLASLARQGIRRTVLFNTHGGNRHVVDAAALRGRSELDALVVKAHSFRFPAPQGLDLSADEWRHGLHGGAVETAMMLHLRPDLVRLEEVSNFTSLGTELEEALHVLLPEGPASFAWMSGDLNAQGATGDATLATAEMGRLLVECYAGFLARIVGDAARFPLDRLGR